MPVVSCNVANRRSASRRMGMAESAPARWSVAVPAPSTLSAAMLAARSVSGNARNRAMRRTKNESRQAVAYAPAMRIAASSDARPTESSLWPAVIKRPIAPRVPPGRRRARSTSAESELSRARARKSSIDWGFCAAINATIDSRASTSIIVARPDSKLDQSRRGPTSPLDLGLDHPEVWYARGE